jgi:hypothetical protein
MLKSFAILVIAVPLLAHAQCRVQDQSVSRSTLSINERTMPRRDIVTLPSNVKQCHVRYRVRVGQDWHDAVGQANWRSDQTVEQACGQAMVNADRLVIENIGRTQIVQNTVMICDDDDRFRQLTSIKSGTVARLEQFRLNPNYPGEFVYNGSRCRWILDTVMHRTDIHTMQGIICQLSGNNWAVVDKF